MGYSLCAGGSWKEDLLPANVHELSEMDAFEVYLRRMKKEEVLVPKEGTISDSNL